MTDKPTPTDAELKALLLDKLPASKHYIRPVIEKMVAAMQAAIDKWGQPAVAAEPVAVVVPCYTPSGKRVALCSAKQDLPIGTKLYAAPQPSPTTHPADSVQEDACHAPPCDSELFESGVSVGLFDMPKWTAEALCKGLAAATGARVDWHYNGGRVHVKALPAPTSAEGAAYAELPDLSDAVNLARNALTQYDCAITKKGVRVLAEAVLSMDSALRTEQPAPSGATEEVENLRKALVYAAFALHDTPQYMLAQGIALIDGDTVRVSRDGWTVEASVNPHRQPAPAQAAEPVAYVEVAQSESEVSMTWGPEPAGFSLPNGRYLLYTPLQPSKTPPAAREPLTNVHIRAMLNKHPPEDVCDWSYRMGIDDAELHHGIKGG